ncbi:phosphoribosylanthranilate isomerase [Caldisphaera lagunensis DSM 15908]|uniref:N-(5'-phosphoribosyl)anthranilate isomerase n=1 Tax=Caldisphaera lagunensis (strain DSM 15908 / JCM 11604 / ANMR 0165 / IC-154) TaxID=1056495 RepID=L0AA12_CALLD|nr:phosphoribosylanthranilate isomerase [Caldisphaera lagunensis]AFZ69890.1 phosphoribosylanthranilate isomerase [Caldisphaera lagunensis DSM 15908]
MTKLKICGVKYLEDVEFLNELKVDYIGMINEPNTPRYVDLEKIRKAINISKIPIVLVKSSINIDEIEKIPNEYIQIHRVLKDEELEMLSTIENKKVILYVPARLDYINYLKKAIKYTKFVLIDSFDKTISNINILKTMLEEYKEAGIAGGININNIYDYVKLEPGFIDISRGVEETTGKKSKEKVEFVLKVIKNEL